MTVSVNPMASTLFWLAADQPVRAKVGTDPEVQVTAGIAMPSQHAYLPWIAGEQ